MTRSADILFKYVKEQADFYPNIEEPRLGRKMNNLTYSRMDYLDEFESSTEMYCSDRYRQVNNEVLDVFVNGECPEGNNQWRTSV